MDRRYLAVVGLLALVATSGCLGMFGGIPQEQLCEDADYDFSTEANATYTITTNGTYRAVYNVSERKTIELYRTDGLGNEHPLQISAVQFRDSKGRAYDCEDIEVKTTRHRTIVTLPEENGTFAYTTKTQPKRFATQRFIDGSHEVILPEDRSVSNPVFGSVKPGGYETSVENDRVHIYWEKADARRIVVQYYMERDIPILLGFIGVAGVGALIGLAYYYRLIRRLRERREEAGLDLDIEDDDSNPPPGMG